MRAMFTPSLPRCLRHAFLLSSTSSSRFHAFITRWHMPMNISRHALFPADGRGESAAARTAQCRARMMSFERRAHSASPIRDDGGQQPTLRSDAMLWCRRNIMLHARSGDVMPLLDDCHMTPFFFRWRSCLPMAMPRRLRFIIIDAELHYRRLFDASRHAKKTCRHADDDVIIWGGANCADARYYAWGCAKAFPSMPHFFNIIISSYSSFLRFPLDWLMPLRHADDDIISLFSFHLPPSAAPLIRQPMLRRRRAAIVRDSSADAAWRSARSHDALLMRDAKKDARRLLPRHRDAADYRVAEIRYALSFGWR